MKISSSTSTIKSSIRPIIDLGNVIYKNGETFDYHSKKYINDDDGYIINANLPKSELTKNNVIAQSSINLINGYGYSLEARIKNGIFYDYENKTYYMIVSGIENSDDILVFSTKTKNCKLLPLVPSYSPRHSDIEIICQTKDHIYFLSSDIIWKKNESSTNYRFIISKSIYKLAKSSDASHIESPSKVYGEINNSKQTYVYSDRHIYAIDKIYDDSDSCYLTAVMNSTTDTSSQNSCVENVLRIIKINKSTGYISGIDVDTDISYKTPYSSTHSTYGFIKDGYINTYCLVGSMYYLLKIKLTDRDINEFDISIKQTNLDYEIFKSLGVEDNFIYPIVNIVDDKPHITFVSLRTYETSYKNKNNIISVKSNDGLNFKKYIEVKNDSRGSFSGFIQVDDKNFLCVRNNSIHHYAWSNIDECYSENGVFNYQNIKSVSVSSNGNVYIQSRESTHLLKLKRKISIDLSFDEPSEGSTYLNIRITDGSIYYSSDLELTLFNCLFEDNSSVKVISVNNNGSTKIKIKTQNNGRLQAYPRILNKNKGD